MICVSMTGIMDINMAIYQIYLISVKLGNISSEEKTLFIFNKYSAKRAVFDCILNSYIVKKTVLQTGRYCWTK